MWLINSHLGDGWLTSAPSGGMTHGPSTRLEAASLSRPPTCSVAQPAVSAVQTAAYRVAVGAKTAGIRRYTATTAAQPPAVLTHQRWRRPRGSSAAPRPCCAAGMPPAPAYRRSPTAYIAPHSPRRSHGSMDRWVRAGGRRGARWLLIYRGVHSQQLRLQRQARRQHTHPQSQQARGGGGVICARQPGSHSSGAPPVRY
jgi:hypothetical protein